MGENTITLDCDVLQADGGTRTASITGAFVALADAVSWGIHSKAMPHRAILRDSVSAVSVGFVGGQAVLDLPYEEDSRAQTDMNVVAVGAGDYIEIQGTAEHKPFSREDLGQLLDLADAGNRRLAELQREVLFGDDPIEEGIIAR